MSGMVVPRHGLVLTLIHLYLIIIQSDSQLRRILKRVKSYNLLIDELAYYFISLFDSFNGLQEIRPKSLRQWELPEN